VTLNTTVPYYTIIPTAECEKNSLHDTVHVFAVPHHQFAAVRLGFQCKKRVI